MRLIANRWSFRFCLSIVVVLLAALLASSASAGRVQTLAVVREVHEFTQDGGRIAWIGYRRTVHVKTLWNGQHVVLGHARPFGYGGAGGVPAGLDGDIFALAGKRVLWKRSGGGNCLETLVMTAALDDRTPRQVGVLDYCDPDGDVTTTLAGDSGTLVYAWVHFEDESCSYISQISSGGAVRVRADSSAIPGLVPPDRIAVGAGEIAVVPADQACGPTAVSPIPNGTVEIREAAGGALVASFAPAGSVRVVALSALRAVVLVEKADGSKRIERYDSSTGAFVGSTPVSASVADELDIAGPNIVYRTGMNIRLLDAETGAKSLLLRASSVPIGLSIENRRVAWAVNRNGKGYIRAILVAA